MRCLSIIQDVFKKPLEASRASNRFVINFLSSSYISDYERLVKIFKKELKPKRYGKLNV